MSEIERYIKEEYPPVPGLVFWVVVVVVGFFGLIGFLLF